MKKLIVFILAIYMSFSLSACTDVYPESETSDQSPGYVIENNTGVMELSQQQIDCLNNSISDITLSTLLNRQKLKQLEKAGVSVALTAVEKLDNDNIRLQFTLSGRRGGTLQLAADGIMVYTPATPNYGNESRMANFCIYWGNISATETEIIFSTNKGVQFYSARTLEKLDKNIDFSFIDTDWYLLDTIACDAGYTVAIVSEEEQSFVVFDTDGRLAEKYDLQKSESHYCYLGYIGQDGMNNTGNNIPLYLQPDVNLTWLDSQQTLLATDVSDAAIYVYDTATDMLYYGYLHVNFTQDKLGLYLIRTGGLGRPYGDYSAPKPWIALRTENGQITDCLAFTTEKLDTVFAESSYTVTADNLCTQLQIECENTATILKINFTDKTTDIQRVEQQLELENELATSATGEYSLYSAARYGGGDISYHQVVLKNNTDGSLKYLDTVGGMYGGNTDAGFMSNGDAYILTTDYFKIFDTDMNNPDPVFTLGEKFPFGSSVDDTVDNRVLLAVRRDPVAFTYLAIYIEQPYYPDYKSQFFNNDEHDLRLKDTYKVGYFDAEGNLVREYDTGVNAVVAMGYAPVNMYLSEDNTLTFWSWFKHRDNVYTRGTLNLETGVYTPEHNAFEK